MRGRLGRGRFAAVAVLAALGGSVTAAVLPAMAATPETVHVLTLPESATVGSMAIAQTPANVDGSWALLTSGDVDQLNADSTLSHESVSGTTFNDSLSVAVADGSVDYVDDGIHLLKVTATGASTLSSTTLASTSIAFPAGIVVGSDGGVYVADMSGGTILDCPAGGGACTTRSVPTAFSGGGGAAGQPGALAVADGVVWFSTVNGDLGSLSSSGTFSAPYHAGAFESGSSDLTSDGTDLWLIGADDASLKELPAASPTATPTSFTVPVPSSIAGATTPQLSSVIVGPDAKIWFTDDANNAVGFLDPATGAVSEYPFPAGDTRGSGPIALGPAGTDSLVVSLANGSTMNLLGQITSPDPIVNGPTSTSTTPGPTTSAPGATTSTTGTATSVPGAPDTTITSGPTGDTWKENPQYTFTSTVPGSTFTCSVDGAPPTACTSPLGIGPFAPGSTHTLKVWATSPSGVQDPSPAQVSVHIHAVEVSTSSCTIGTLAQTALGYVSGCSIEFQPNPPGCAKGEPCIVSTSGCPADAACTLTTHVGFTMPGDSADWFVAAQSVIYTAGGVASPLLGSCRPQSGSAGCTAQHTARINGPDVQMESDCWAYVNSGGGMFGPADGRQLDCRAQLTVAPQRPLYLQPAGGGVVDIFAPSPGALSVSSAAGTAAGQRVAARTAPTASFRAVTLKVKRAGTVAFRPRLSAAARRTFRRHHRLTLRLRVHFKPIGDGPSFTRIATVVLMPAARAPRTCPVHPRRNRKLLRAGCRPRQLQHR